MSRYLLDTHVALWAVFKDRQLSTMARDYLEDDDAEVFVSTLSLWEVAIKNARRPGALPPVAEFRKGIALADFREAPFSGDMAEAFENFPARHGDPFDRALAVQAFSLPMTLLTADRTLAALDKSKRVIVLV